jgi:cytochrome b6-f complex iron-sulfur subunit
MSERANDVEPTPGPEEKVGRRRFLRWAWKILGLGLLVEAGWTTFDILNPKPSSAFGGVIDAGKVGDYPAGTVRYFMDGRFYVTSANGGLVALFQKCPHLGCRVPFCESSGRFECPCHGSIYNIRGEYIGGPAPRGMDRFPIRIQGGSVMVDTGKTVEGPPRGIRTVPGAAKGPSCVNKPSGGAGG